MRLCSSAEGQINSHLTVSVLLHPYLSNLGAASDLTRDLNNAALANLGTASLDLRSNLNNNVVSQGNAARSCRIGVLWPSTNMGSFVHDAPSSN